MSKEWCKLCVKRKELQLLGTLNGGQSFRWKKLDSAGKEQWVGVFAKKVWFLQQNDDHILYKVHENESPDEPARKKTKKSNEDNESLLRNYFQLDLNLEDHYAKWSEADPFFKKAAQQFYGIRILKQDPIENIFSFICSSNNNISRITSMVEKLATFYGEKICDIDDAEYYAFPTIDQLNGKGVETKLRTNGFGYRAKFISRTAEMIREEGGEKWVENLKGMKYEEAKKELMKLTGIGAKVADCIALMSLGHLQSIPVDTHIYQIAARLYMPKLREKSKSGKPKAVTEKVYNEIGDHFRDLYGPLAGWAHTVLFCADLKKFQGDGRDVVNGNGSLESEGANEEDGNEEETNEEEANEEEANKIEETSKKERRGKKEQKGKKENNIKVSTNLRTKNTAGVKKKK